VRVIVCGKLAVCLQKLVLIRACVKARQPNTLSAKMQSKEEWAIMVFVLNALPVLENSVSTEWVFHWQHRLPYQLIVQDTA